MRQRFLLHLDLAQEVLPSVEKAWRMVATQVARDSLEGRGAHASFGDYGDRSLDLASRWPRHRSYTTGWDTISVIHTWTFGTCVSEVFAHGREQARLNARWFFWNGRYALSQRRFAAG